MPAKPSWFRRVPEILEALRATADLPYLEREAIERLFGVRRRRAHQLMAAFGGVQIGKTYLVDRRQLVDALERIAGGDPFLWEVRRKAKLARVLEEAHRQVAGRKVRIASPASPAPGRWPPGVTLHPGELRLEFASTQQLLERLFALSQAILENYEQFQRRAEERRGADRDQPFPPESTPTSE